MHEQISFGSQNVLFGPFVFLEKLKIVIPAGEAQPPSRDVKRVSCGKRQNICNTNLAVAQELLDNVARFDAKHGKLLLPQTPEESRKFTAAVDEFLQGFPSQFGYGTSQQHGVSAKAGNNSATNRKKPPAQQPAERKKPPAKQRLWAMRNPRNRGGGVFAPPSNSSSGYCKRSILRKIILWVQTRTPQEAWDCWSTEMLWEVCPDKNNFLSHWPGDSTASSLARTFSMNAFMISCWACLFSSVAAEHRAAFEQADVRLLWISLALKKHHDRVEPSLRTLGAEATKRVARC